MMPRSSWLGQQMQFHRMNRRQVITLLGGAAAWPLAARAQQAGVPVIGLLSSVSLDAVAERLRGFRQGLKETGFSEGDNVAITYRFAENQIDRLPGLATDLVRRQVAVIAASGDHVALVAKAATTAIPIVFIVAEDPVRLGLVASLARPGGNVTGMNFFAAELTAKRLELVRALLPTAARVAVLLNPDNATATESTLRDLAAASRAIGLQIEALNAKNGHEIEAAFATLVRERPDALLVNPDPYFSSRRMQLVTLATRHAIPLVGGRELIEIGGLMSYGANVVDTWRQQGVYVGRILKGAKPGDLPVVQSTKFELVINAHTARMLGLVLPDKLLATADEVIE
jgi:putative ABC transport system substrate-binding protein